MIVKTEDYKICTRCVMDTSDPHIQFDEQGVCDHCYDYDKNVKPNWDTGKKGRAVLEAMTREIRTAGKGKDFDCILGLSGGLDSSYMLHYVVKEMDLRPLVFHVDAGWNSELAVHNINVMIDGLGLDLYTEVINWEEMKDFQLAFFKSGVPHLDIPQDQAFMSTMYHFANRYNIRHILNGGNFSTECVQYPMEWFYYGSDMRFINDIRRRFVTNPMNSFPFSSILYHKVWLRYFRGVKVVKPLNFTRYVKKEAEQLLQTTYGWRPYPQKHFESRFTKFFEGYWLPERFGFEPLRVQLAGLILTGQISRDEALDRLSRPAYDPESIGSEFSYIATKLGITDEELRGYFKMPKRFYYDYRNQQTLFRIGARLMRSLGLEKVKKREG
jgi:N-acetyl sugar amidotransferase